MTQLQRRLTDLEATSEKQALPPIERVELRGVSCDPDGKLQVVITGNLDMLPTAQKGAAQ